jgi:hypothetical protein
MPMYSSSSEKDVGGISIQEQTFLIYRRYYFVARLDKTIKLLAKMYQEVNAMREIFAEKHITFEDIVPEETYRLFTHKQIRHSVKEISHTRSLKPLFMVWDSFKAYKFLHDDLLVEDFSKEIFIITRNTIDSLHKQLLHKNHIKIADYSVEELFNKLSLMASSIESLLSGNDSVYMSRKNDMSDIHMAVHTDDVAFRYYCIRRLSKAFDLLRSLPETSQDVQRMHIFLKGRFFEKYRKPSARQSYKKLWDDLIQYKYIDNEGFTHSFAAYILTMLYVKSSESEIHKRLSQADLIELHKRIEQLPLEEILQTIDLVVKQMQNVVNHYQKSGLTLGQWIKRYWWAPPVIITTIALKCFVVYYKNIYRST